MCAPSGDHAGCQSCAASLVSRHRRTIRGRAGGLADFLLRSDKKRRPARVRRERIQRVTPAAIGAKEQMLTRWDDDAKERRRAVTPGIVKGACSERIKPRPG